MTDIAKRKPVSTLTRHQQLQQHEAVIAEGKAVFIKVSNAIYAIFSQELYREKGYENFKDYVTAEHPEFKNRRYADYLVDAGATVKAIEAHNTLTPNPLPLPVSERSVRPLAKVPEPERAPVWKEAVTEARQAGRETPTYRDTERVMERREARALQKEDPDRKVSIADQMLHNVGKVKKSSSSWIEPSELRGDRVGQRLYVTAYRPPNKANGENSRRKVLNNTPCLIKHLERPLAEAGYKLVPIMEEDDPFAD